MLKTDPSGKSFVINTGRWTIPVYEVNARGVTLSSSISLRDCAANGTTGSVGRESSTKPASSKSFCR